MLPFFSPATEAQGQRRSFFHRKCYSSRSCSDEFVCCYDDFHARDKVGDVLLPALDRVGDSRMFDVDHF